MTQLIQTLIAEIDRLPGERLFGRVVGVRGLVVEIGGVQGNLSVGDRVRILTRDHRAIPCEVVGFRAGQALLLPFRGVDGVGLGCRAELTESAPMLHPADGWLGRVINAFGEAVDGKEPMPLGERAYPVRAQPPPAHRRQRVGGKLDLGVRALNTFLTCCRGQRMGIFAGSGVGKSTILSMLIRHSAAEVVVIGLVGERGREAREFIEDDLGEAGLARSVVVLATSDESPLMRRQAAHATLTVAEYFRDQGKHVLCLMDSVTRFAMAQREISLSAGEPPASKGYTPSVFAELPRLLERAGPGVPGTGSITGLFTVLVEGDDHNEPVSDAVRGILDGHIVLDRAIAERGRYPAINILRSVSRTMPACNTPDQNQLVNAARRIITTYEDMAELIRLGAYRAGSNAEVDAAIHYYPMIDTFLAQTREEATDLATGYDRLRAILESRPEAGPADPGAAPTPGAG
ncbi:flagellar protein export ATPase FliI [Roseospira visakhapatnamensis]|uniref:Flagellum-specific ATP synthase n=1 Tax=Roseospira visakhapatnamensis TaxID=390880 RepID=A0A7W6W9F6_9PROT|nr:flagellar protein export ATPase FliI [Roseospira visakhapatnamensis]MBB4266075.1 flagellum-specific ATP synthase [Roseospira visakhapatnamensis]